MADAAGEAIGPEIFALHRSIGINVKPFYGMPESSALMCIRARRVVTIRSGPGQESP